MNRLVFYVDEYDSVKKCEYIEPIYGSGFVEYRTIILPDIELHNLFNEFIRKNPQIEPEQDGNKMVFTFYDLDVEKMDDLIERSLEYQNRLLEKKRNEMGDLHKYSNKVERTNRFKKTAMISISAAMLLSLYSFFTYKNKETNNNNQNDIDSGINIAYADNKLSKREISDSSYNYEKNEIIVENNENDMKKMPDKSSSDNVINSEQNDTDDIDNMSYSEKIENIEIDAVLRLEAENAMDSNKYYIATKYYYDAIAKYADMYGIDPMLALAVGTHERGIHRDTVDPGGAIGLFQIQVEGGWNWDGKTITAYNFKTCEYDSEVITIESVSDVFKNIKVGCMLIQNALVKYNYNVAEAIMAYNYGENYLSTVINRCSQETGLSTSELNKLECLEWLNYRNVIDGGDPYYLENVFQYIPNGTILKFKKIDGGEVNIEYQNVLNYKKGIN